MHNIYRIEFSVEISNSCTKDFETIIDEVQDYLQSLVDENIDGFLPEDLCVFPRGYEDLFKDIISFP